MSSLKTIWLSILQIRFPAAYGNHPSKHRGFPPSSPRKIILILSGSIKVDVDWGLEEINKSPYYLDIYLSYLYALYETHANLSPVDPS